jgi:alpha,alpha-trehalase
MSIEAYMDAYNDGTISEPQLDEYFLHDRAVRESGHDTTYRFEGRCANLATIDLNSLIYKYEMDIHNIIKDHFGGVVRVRVRKGLDDINFKNFLVWFKLVSQLDVADALLQWNCSWARGIHVYDLVADQWMHNEETLAHEIEYMDIEGPDFIVVLPSHIFRSLARKNKDLVNEYLWDPERCLYFDWDCKLSERSTYETVTCLWALWAGLASPSQAAQMVPHILTTFEHVGGLVSGTMT